MRRTISRRKKAPPITKGFLVIALIAAVYGLLGYRFHSQGIQTITYTFAAITAIFALFKETASNYILRPELNIKLICGAPNCNKTSFGWHEIHYFRLRVENIGTRSADNVEVAIESVKMLQKGCYVQDDNYVPMQLLWSLWRKDIPSMNIPGGTYRFCDLGFILHPSAPAFQIDTGPVYPKNQTSQLLFWFDSRFRPNAGTTHLTPGQYQLEISAYGKDVPRTVFYLHLDWRGGWAANTDDVFDKELLFS